MSTLDRSLEQRLTDLLADEAPMRGPDALVGAVLARTRAERPRRRWLTLVNESPMQLDDRPAFGSRPVRTAATLVAAMLLALFAVGTIVAGASLLRPSPAPLIPPESGVFTPTGPMLASRGHAHMGPTFTATLLVDGRVLVVGGIAGAEAPIAGTEVWDPVSGTFTATGAMAVARGDHTATLLPDGSVLVVGGYGAVDGGSNSVASAEIWDPVRGTFELTGSLTARRRQHTATVLLDGRVLIAGGTDDTIEILPAAEIWDPDTGASTALGPPVDALKGRSATRLGDGRVLLVGGAAGDVPVASAELFDPVLGTFSPTGSLVEQRFGHTAMLSPDGRVLVVGGTGADERTIERAEFWDPETGAFSPAGEVMGLRYGTAITMLDDGTILIVGGITDPASDLPSEEFGGHLAWIWDPATGDARPAGSPTEDRVSPAATLLADGRVLIVGGLGPEAPSTDCRPAGSGSRIRGCSYVEPALDSAELWSPRDWSP